MVRDINTSGIVFEASTAKTLFFALLCGGLCAYSVYSIMHMKEPIDPLHGSRAMRSFIGIGAISALFSVLNFLILLKEDFCSLQLTQEKMIYRFIWLHYEWKWDDIDQLHLQAPEPPGSMFAVFHFIIVMFSKLLPLGKTELRFQDYAFEEKRTKRWILRPKKDGFVSLPLGYFSSPDEIFAEADRLHAAWFKRKQIHEVADDREESH